MKIGIICASDRELAPFGRLISNRKYSQTALLTVCEGTIAKVPVAALYSGVCKVNAAIAAMTLIHVYGCDTIINSGTAGGLDSHLKIFSTVVATESEYHDVAPEILTEFHPWKDTSAFRSGDTLLQAARKVAKARKNVFYGKMATGEQFVDGPLRDKIKEKMSPLTVDMETAAIAHVCYATGVPFLAVRTLTDHADGGAEGDFQKNCEEASRLSAEFVSDIIAELGVTL